MADATLDQTVDTRKRRFLITATSAVGGVGVVVAAVPFVMSFWPSARAKAAGAPVEVDISKVEPGQLITVEWRGKVCWVLNRTKPMLDSLPKLDSRLADPEFERPEPARLLQERASLDQGQLLGRGRHLHAPRLLADVPSRGRAADLGPDWLGGFFCPCHQSKFDLAGRVYKGVPAPTNLVIPPHKYLSDTKIVIGHGQDGKDV